jgi:DNA-binding NtrC family response regulator
VDDERTEREQQAGAPIARLRVEVKSGPDAGAVLEREDAEDALGVGTAEGNSLRLSDPKVSRYHLELVRQDNGVLVQDLGSLNGTWIGNVRIQQAVVFPGTEIRAGDTSLVIRDGTIVEAIALERTPELPQFVAVSRKSLRTVYDIRKLAPSSATVLIRGETGSGKEVVARALHDLSPRHDKPFVVVDCGSMPATLIASELFGHERGAFTGADRRRKGAFERADGGTVFLDEIGELPLAVQPALLGVLERRRFRRVGGDEDVAVDVRVVAATHRDLRQSVNDGSFRADLFYRLAVARVQVIPLRERVEDIPALVAHFVRELTGRTDHDLLRPEVLAALARHRWSGNVRELRNVVESALAMGDLRIEPTKSEPATPSPSTPPAFSGELSSYRDARSVALADFEKQYLTALVAKCGSNASEAARIAHMDRNYLVSLLRKHGLR